MSTRIYTRMFIAVVVVMIVIMESVWLDDDDGLIDYHGEDYCS